MMTIKDLIIEIGNGNPLTEHLLNIIDEEIPSCMEALLKAAMIDLGIDRVGFFSEECGCRVDDFAPCGCASPDCELFRDGEKE